jgi:archaellum component FlaC
VQVKVFHIPASADFIHSTSQDQMVITARFKLVFEGSRGVKLKKEEKLFTSRVKFIAVGIVCLVLAFTFVVVVVNYRAIIYAKNSELATRKDENQNLTDKNNQLQSWLSANITAFSTQITELERHISDDKEQIRYLQGRVVDFSAQVTKLENQISSGQIQIAEGQAQINDFQDQIKNLNSQIENITIQDAVLEGKISEYTQMFNMEKIQLNTLVFHVCEKDWVHVPDVNATYNYLVDLFGGQYNVILLPEYQDGGNWTQTLNWLNASFGGPDGIPIMLQVFAGGNGTTPTPMLSINDMEDALSVANVKYLRIFEVISWHMENNQTFPVEYVNQVLEFARNNYLKIFWSEWKNDLPPEIEVFQAIKEYIAGYEDIVTVSFGTNSGNLEPGEGFLQLVDMFEHWGASVQSWYWNTHYSEDPADMPASLFVQQTLIAIYVGAELIQI